MSWWPHSRETDLELGKVFRVSTADWSSVQWAWDKRNTYRLAEELKIPVPRTRYLDHIDQLSELDSVSPPFAIKPAIKEHFVYATKAKAWCASSHEELRETICESCRVGRSE